MGVMTDLELARRAGNGDKAAFQEILERHYDTVYRIAVRFTGNEADGADIAQDVCLSLADKIASFRGKSQFSTWLYRIVINACRDFARRQKTVHTLQDNYAVFRERDDADTRHNAERRDWLNETVQGLPPQLRETALLVLGEDLNHADAARALGCAESTVSWRMHKVRKKLKELVDTFHDG